MRLKLLTSHITSVLLIASAMLATACESSTTAITSNSGTDQTVVLPQPEQGNIEKLPDNARQPSLTNLLNFYNSRNLGSPGWRRVTLELVTNREVTRSFTVVNLWRSESHGVNTLFTLEKPEGLKGTSYLLEEGGNEKNAADMNVHLFLPAGERRVLEIAPDNLDEGLLGSDFTYTDLRMLLPVEGYRYRLLGQSALLHEPAWVIEAEPSTPRTRRISSWQRARFYLMKNAPLLLGADYEQDGVDGKGSPRMLRQMRVEVFKQIDGVWTATRMVMSGADDRASVLSLQEAHFTLKGWEASIFSPQGLPSLSDKVREGWSPSVSAER